MIITSTSASSTQPSYNVKFDANDQALTVGQLADLIRPFNYGSQVISVGNNEVNFRIFID